jgi:hypothetical protein
MEEQALMFVTPRLPGGTVLYKQNNLPMPVLLKIKKLKTARATSPLIIKQTRIA